MIITDPETKSTDIPFVTVSPKFMMARPPLIYMPSTLPVMPPTPQTGPASGRLSPEAEVVDGLT